MNHAAVDKTLDHLVEVKYPAGWAEAGAARQADDDPVFVTKVIRPMVAQQGDKLPVSAFTPDGVFPWPRPGMKTAVLPSTFRNGSWTTASSATSAPWSVPMRLSVRCW